jgi:predicted permease
MLKPGFALLATLTLAVGIGANAAVFSLLDAVYFRPLPLRESERLVRVTSSSPRTVFGLLSYTEVEELRASVPAFSDVVAAGGRGVTLHQGGETRPLLVRYVSANFFDALGAPLGRGRGFRSEDDGASSPLVVINHHLWQNRLGGKPDVIGSTIQLNDNLFTVIGVTAPGFLGLDRSVRTDVFVLAAHARYAIPGLAREVADRSGRWFDVYARLARGATIDEARAEAATLRQRWGREDPKAYAGTGLIVVGFDDHYRAGTRDGSVFLGLVSLVLLIACANVANLTLARSEGRRRELAVRAALGASRGRLVRYLLAESLALALAGTAAGLLVAAWLMQAFPALVPPSAITYTLDLRFDGRLLAFAGLLLVLSTVFVAVVPAWRHSRPDVVLDLKLAEARAERSDRAWNTRDLLVVVEMAVSVIVLISAGLLVRNLFESTRLNPGFDTAKRVASFDLVPGLSGYDRDATYRFFEEARRRASALAGVRRATYAIRLPAQGNEAGWAADFVIPGKEPPRGEEAFRIRYTMVGPGYFEVLGTRILRGRGVGDADGPGSPPVAVINETMAERLWPGEDPIGKRLVMGRKAPVEREIVGVAEDGKIADLFEPPEMYVFVPFAQDRQEFALLLVETSVRPDSIFGPVRKQIAEIDRALAVLDTSTLDRHMAFVLFEERRDAWIAAGVGLLALLLGAVGIYGVVSLVTARRTREIGIRVALGAQRGDVLRLVLGRGTKLALFGCALGTAGGLAATRLLSSRLHGVSTSDPLSFLGGAFCLVVAATLASLLPAWRAARMDPSTAIREE